MKTLTFAELCSRQNESPEEYDLHIIVEAFKEQILCKIKDFPRAYKICMLRGKQSVVIRLGNFTMNERTRIPIEDFKTAYDKRLYK